MNTPSPCPIEARTPAFRPFSAVQARITIRLGPGESAPRRQILINDSQSAAPILTSILKLFLELN